MMFKIIKKLLRGEQVDLSYEIEIGWVDVVFAITLIVLVVIMLL